MRRPIVLLVALLIPTMTIWSGCAGPDGPVAGSALEPTVAEAATAAPESGSRTGSIMGEVVFPHDEHAEDLEIACEECHHDINATELITPHSEYFEDFWINCQICHRGFLAGGSDPEACSDCHQSHLGEVGDQTQSSKVVVHQLCWSCHAVGVGQEAAGACQQCHTGAQERS